MERKHLTALGNQTGSISFSLLTGEQLLLLDNFNGNSAFQPKNFLGSTIFNHPAKWRRTPPDSTEVTTNWINGYRYSSNSPFR